MWQTEAMAEAVRFLSEKTPVSITLREDNQINSVVQGNDTQIQEFAPSVKLVGLGLWRERFGATSKMGPRVQSGWKRVREKSRKDYSKIQSWGGVYTRTMEDSSSSWRCLQYIYIYTRQRGVISLVWNFLIPLLMALWGWFTLASLGWDVQVFLDSFDLFPSIYLTRNEWMMTIAGFSIWMVVTIPVFIIGISPHMSDYSGEPEERGFRFRTTTVLVPLAILIALYPFFEIMGPLLAGIGFLFLLIWIAEKLELISSGHKMDYVPVFVWLRKVSDNWNPEYVTWDYAHYHAKTTKFCEMPKMKGNPNRVLLNMSENWHAMEKGSWYESRLTIFVVLFYLIAMNSFFLVVSLPTGTLSEQLLMTYFLHAGYPSVFIIIGLLVMKLQFDLVPNINNYTSINAPLTYSKLLRLWNFNDSARFKIVTKMQDSFRHFRQGKCFDNFNVELKDLLY